MKKLGALLAIFVMFGLTAGCGTDDAGAGRGPSNSQNDTGTDALPDTGGTDTSPDSETDTCVGAGCGSSGDVCASDEDCTAPEICTVDRSGDTFELTCQVPSGSGELGDSCSADGDCASNLCVDGECSKPCERPADCSDDGSFLCKGTELATGTGGTEDVDVCLRRPASECASNADCTSPEQCVATKTDTEVIFSCGAPNSGGAAVGESCSTDADCTQNLCQGGTCSAPCASVGDCSAGDGYSCEIEPVDLGNGNTKNEQVCTAPRACSSKADCRTGEVCRLDRTTGETTCRQPNAGGGELGDQCSDDVSCAANLCNEERFGDVCTVACVDDSHCPTPGYECGTATIDDGSGGTLDVSVCVAEAPVACTSNDDCASGRNCAVVPNAAGNGLETVCIPSNGDSATGVDCTTDDDCAGLVCTNNTCSTPCANTNQCAGGQLCQSNIISKGGLNGTFDMCETLPEERCDTTGTCSDNVRMCNDVRVASGGAGSEAYCGMTNPGAPGGLADHCANRTECRSSLCLRNTSDECTVICANDSQCGQGQICTTFDVGGSQLGYCISGCADNDDCAGLAFTSGGGATVDHVCTTNENMRDDNVDQICVRRNIVDPNDDQEGLLGDTCQDGGDCQSGLCLTNTVFNGTACSSAADCDFTFDGTSCSTDSDCGTNQVCQVEPSSGQRQCAKQQVCEMSTNGSRECGDQSQFCTRICDEGTDCSGGIAGNTLTTCDTGITMPLSSGTVDTISACSPN